MTPLRSILAELRYRLPWPIIVDHNTNNLIVHVDADHGFVITCQALKQMSIAQIVEQSQSAERRPLRDIRAEAHGPTYFDAK